MKAVLEVFGCWPLWGRIPGRIEGVFGFWKKGERAGDLVFVGVSKKCSSGVNFLGFVLLLFH